MQQYKGKLTLVPPVNPLSMKDRPAPNTEYYTLAAWTARGVEAHKCVWTDDLVDEMRLAAGNVFATKEAAEKSIKD